MAQRAPAPLSSAVPDHNPQLALPFRINEQCRLDNFQVDAAGRNAELLARLPALPLNEGFAGLWLWGSPGSGVSHLLQAVCHRFGEAGLAAAYLPLAEAPRASEVLEGLERFALLALDDVQLWAGSERLEVTLVSAYQSARTRGQRLVLGADCQAGALVTVLPDLASRLGSLESYRVHPLDDAGKGVLLSRLASRRGLTLAEPVLNFWLARAGRELPLLLEQLDALDRAALRDQRALTIPLVKQVLGL